MAILPMRRNPLTSMLNFALEREREAASLGNVISQIAKPTLDSMGVQTEETAPQPAVLRGPAPMAQPLGTFTGPAMAPTLVQDSGVGDDFMRRLIRQESGGNPNAVSPKGATGLTQVMPSTAVDPGYGVPTIFDLADEQGVDYGSRTEQEAARLLLDPDLNLQFGTLYANAMSRRFGGDPTLTAAAYNAGPGAVEQYGGVPPFAETQNYVRNVAGGTGSTTVGGGAGADRLGGGNVEDILAQLYPQMSPEEEKKQRRKDFFAAASQGLSALSQGRPIDFSNIRQAQEQRQRQAVQDMRERERARSAASLVFEQTGDRDLASAIATGAISYGDVVSERERLRVEEAADEARVRKEQASGRLATIIEQMGPDLGIPEAVLPQIIESVRAGDDPNTFLTLQEKARVADAAREADEKAAESAAARTRALEEFAASPDEVERLAGRFMALDPNLSLDDALSRANEQLKKVAEEGFTLSPGQVRFGPGGEQVAAVPSDAATAKPFQFQAEIDARMRNLGEDIETATRAVLDEKQQQGLTLQIDPTTGAITFTQGSVPATSGATAAGGVVDVAKAAPGTATVVQDGQLVSVPVVGSPEYDAAMLDIETQEQALAQAIATAPSVEARAAAEAQLAQVQAQKAALTMPTDVATAEVELATKRQTLESAIANASNELEKAKLETELLRLERDAALSNQSVDAATKEAQLASIEADVAKKQAEVEALEREEAQKSSAQYKNAVQQFGQVDSAAKIVANNANSGWATGVAGGIATTIGGSLNIPTLRTEVLSAAKQIGSQAMLDALKEAKAAGVALTPVSNLDIAVLGASESPLLEPEALRGDRLVEAVSDRYNYLKDQLFGPKDLTRLDQYGNEYTVGQNTLGVSEDEFSYHWAQIPPEVAAAWKNGELPLFPTDDPEYADAATMLNALTANWNVYQGDLDRTLVGEAETPPEPTDAADLPPPPSGIPADEWAETWQFMSQAARDAYIKQTQGAK